MAHYISDRELRLLRRNVNRETEVEKGDNMSRMEQEIRSMWRTKDGEKEKYDESLEIDREIESMRKKCKQTEAEKADKELSKDRKKKSKKGMDQSNIEEEIQKLRKMRDKVAAERKLLKDKAGKGKALSLTEHEKESEYKALLLTEHEKESYDKALLLTEHEREKEGRDKALLPTGLEKAIDADRQIVHLERNKDMQQEPTCSYAEFLKTLDRYDRSSTRRESKIEESPQITIHIRELERRLESLQEENELLKKKESTKENITSTNDPYSKESYRRKEKMKEGDKLPQDRDGRKRDDTDVLHLSTPDSHFKTHGRKKESKEYTKEIERPLSSLKEPFTRETPGIQESKNIFYVKPEKEKEILSMRKHLLKTERESVEKREQNSRELRIQLDEDDRQIDRFLSEEKFALQELLVIEKEIDEKIARQREEERLIEEKIASIQSKREEYIRQKEETLALEQRIRQKEEESELYERRLESLRRKEEEFRKLARDESELYRMKLELSKDRDDEHRKVSKEDIRSEDSRVSKPEPERYYGKPNVPSFDGTSFEEWKLEVNCLLKSNMYPEHLIKQSVRNSLKGPTRKILLTLRENVSTEDIVRKLEDIYGRVETEDADWQEFFTATQKEGETSSTWAIRLESLLQLAARDENISETRRNKMLKDRFWKGLRSEKLKADTRVSYETESKFETLRNKVRKEEKEMMTEKQKAEPGKVSSVSKPQTESEQMMMMKDLLDRLKRIEGELNKRQNTATDQKKMEGNRRDGVRNYENNYNRRWQYNRYRQERKDEKKEGNRQAQPLNY